MTITIKPTGLFKHEILLNGVCVGWIAGSARCGHYRGVVGGYNVRWLGEEASEQRFYKGKPIYDFAYFKDAVRYARENAPTLARVL